MLLSLHLDWAWHITIRVGHESHPSPHAPAFSLDIPVE
jgi:hypothetical protein